MLLAKVNRVAPLNLNPSPRLSADKHDWNSNSFRNQAPKPLHKTTVRVLLRSHELTIRKGHIMSVSPYSHVVGGVEGEIRTLDKNLLNVIEK